MEMGCLNIMQNRPDNRIYAGFFVRLAAYIVDTVIVWAAMLIVRIPVWVTTISSPDNFLVKDFIFQYSMQAAYFILLTYFTGSTLGKKLFQIRVVSAEDRKMTFFEVTFRETVGRFLSALILSIGYIMIAIDKKKRGLHDILSDTNVVYYHEKKVYTHADIHYRNMVDANVQAVAQPQNPNSHGEVNVQPQNQNPYGEVNGQPQNQNPYEKVNTQPQNQDNKSVYSNDTEDFDNTDNAEVSSVKTVHPQNMPSGYFEDADDKDGK
jgi:uncharacterized RDD family membrane protein YckC